MTDSTPNVPSLIAPVTIEDEMRRSYLDYAMSVIVSRALPDVRDGLKPVHRRILYAMKEGGYDSGKPYKKSARIVGDVMGKYHPHGDSAIYDAMVRMAQDFSMRLPLVDGQGNFGSMDGDNAAAMRYTEARLAKTAEAMLEDIDKDTVDFHPNYDESTEEPDVLPARFPNLLVNGAGGIAVGMATNIAPHNLGEVIDATLALMRNPDISIEELVEIIPGPDFPTGAMILGHSGCRSAMHTGRGSISMRARHTIEDTKKDRQAIVFTEIPYQVNKVKLIERIAECVNEKIIEGISDVNDHSDRDGVRVVVDIKRDAMAEVVLNQLYAHTPLQTNFSVNMLALNGGRPQLMNVKQVLQAFIDFREKVITRRTEYELRQARDRAHILVGLAVAVANIDEIIALIRRANDPAIAKQELMAKAWPVGDVGPLITMVDEFADLKDGTYHLSETQAKAILDLRLHRLTGLERDKIGGDLKNVVAQIADYLDILANRPRVFKIMEDELSAIRIQFATPRRTTIEAQEFETDIEDLIQREDMVVTVSHAGYVKRVPLSTYRAQKRGGKGRAGMATKDEDFVNDIFVASTHTPMLFFSSLGRVYKLKVYKLPLGNPTSRGKAMVNLLPLEQTEVITTVMHLPEDEETWESLNVMFATVAGTVRRNQLSDFSNVRPSGIIAMKLEDGDKLISVQTCTDQNDVVLATRLGKAIRFPVDDVRVFTGRTSVGVRGIKMVDGDEVISMSILGHVDSTADERAAYIRQANAARRASGEATEDVAAAGGEEEESATAIILSPERYADMETREEFLLTVSERGFGKRTSAYEYRLAGRGGQGIWNMDMSERNGQIVATFPVRQDQDIMLVTNGGQVIRMPIKDIRIAGRRTQGVTVFRVDATEKVVSVAVMDDQSGEGGEISGDEGASIDA